MTGNTGIHAQVLKEMQGSLNILEEQLIGLSNNPVVEGSIENIRSVLHNIKNKAILINCNILSEQAAQLEKVFKVLKLHKEFPLINLEVENLLLASIDCLRQIISSNFEGAEVDNIFFSTQPNIILNNLWQRIFKIILNAKVGSLFQKITKSEQSSLTSISSAEVLGGSLAQVETSMKKLILRLYNETLTIAQDIGHLGEMLDLDDWSQVCSFVVKLLESHPNLIAEIIIAVFEAWQKSRPLAISEQATFMLTELEVEDLTLIESLSPIKTFNLPPAKEQLKLPTLSEEAIKLTHLSSKQLNSGSPSTSTSKLPKEQKENSFQIPVVKLDKLNDLVEEVKIDCYEVEQNLEKIQNLMTTQNYQVQILDQTNAQLCFAYKKALFQKTKELQSSSENNGLNILGMERDNEIDNLFQNVLENIAHIQKNNIELKRSLSKVEQVAAKQRRSFNQMQATLTSARKRPLLELLSSYPHYLRELSLKHGKKVELLIEGGETLIDSKILQALGHPLVHLLQNTLNFGIENPDVRQTIGKPPEGKIEIKACQTRDKVVITISDDGSGVDVEKIGLDVVRTNLERVCENVRVDTVSGLGTTFTLTVPDTLSSLRVLLVESKGFLLAFPCDAIEEMFPLKDGDLFNKFGNYMLNYKESLITLIRLSDWLEYSSNRRQETLKGDPDINVPFLIVVNQSSNKIALQFERCWGEREGNIRQVEKNILMPAGFKGCIVLSDGKVVPLVNLEQLIRAHKRGWGRTQEENKS